MKWLAFFIWVLATFLALGWVSFVLMAYEISRTAPDTDQAIWRAVLFGPPFYVVPAWAMVSGACLFLIIRKPRP